MTDSALSHAQRTHLNQAAIHYLNSVFAADPLAVHCLTTNRVAANQTLAHHPYAVCDEIRVLPDGAAITAIGLLSGLLLAMGLSPVTPEFDATLSPSPLVGFKHWDPADGHPAGPAIEIERRDTPVQSG